MYSFEVFMRFVEADGNAERVLSKDCYNLWVQTRNSPPKEPEESFRRALTAHLCGLDGRRPFPVDVERDILRIIRQRKVWKCFEDTSCPIGVKGFRNLGFHESNKLAKEIDTNFTNSSKRKRKRGECKLIKKKWLEKKAASSQLSFEQALPRYENKYVSIRGQLKWKQPYPLRLGLKADEEELQIEIPKDVQPMFHDEEPAYLSKEHEMQVELINKHLWRICVVMTIMESQINDLVTKTETENIGIFDEFFDLLFNSIDNKLKSTIERVLIQIGRDFCQNQTLVVYLNDKLRKLPKDSSMTYRRYMYVKVVLNYIQEFLDDHGISIKNFCRLFDFTPPDFVVELARCRLTLIHNYLRTLDEENRPYTKCGTVDLDDTKMVSLVGSMQDTKASVFHALKKKQTEMKKPTNTFYSLPEDIQNKIMNFCNGSQWVLGGGFAEGMEYVREKYLGCSWMIQKILRIMEKYIYVQLDDKYLHVYMRFKNVPLIQLCFIADGELHEYKDALSWLPLSRPLIKAYKLYYETKPETSLVLEYHFMNSDKIVRRIFYASPQNNDLLQVQGQFMRKSKTKEHYEVLHTFYGNLQKVA